MLLLDWHLWYISTKLLELLHHWHHRHHRHHLRDIWNLSSNWNLLLILLVLWSCGLLRFRLLRFFRSCSLFSTMLFFMMLLLFMFVFTFSVSRLSVIMFNIYIRSLQNFLYWSYFLDNFNNFLNNILSQNIFRRSSCVYSLFNWFFFWFVHNSSRFLFFTRFFLFFLPLRLLILGFNSVLLCNYLFDLNIFCYSYWLMLNNFNGLTV